MKVSNLVGDRFKERPADCAIDSHALMVRGGYIKHVGNGIFSLFPPAKRIMQKIERIIREEMDAIDGQEVLFPVALPASLWQESGRYESVGSELLRFTDRNGQPMVLGMTHEEAAVQMVRDYAQSYTKYPFMIYQIQTKFRDEPRARGGLIRVREFTMKDAYSFHTSQADLEAYYARCYKAYHRIFARAGIPDVVAVLSDSGMMGGSISHEYMLLTDIGEDTLALCGECDYKSNMEAAACIVENEAGEKQPLEKVFTPDKGTIEEVTAFLHSSVKTSCKAVVYQKNMDDSYVVVFIRGDLDVNETKLTNYLKAEIHPAVITPESGIVAGFIGPVGLKADTVVFDRSLEGIESLVCGANEKDYHYTGLNVARDVGDVAYVDVAKTYAGAICPRCGKPAIHISRGIEVGNIFQLGTKYTKAMGMQYVDANGELQYPIMGCYGIGVGRLCASVCEASHDQYGPIWPITIAPWQAQVCCLRVDDPQTKETAQKIYDELQAQGVETLYDDRDIRPGNMFSDADLLGAPIRVVVSPRGLKDGLIEVTTRDKKVDEKVPAGEAAQRVRELIGEMTKAIMDKVPER